MLLAGVVLSIFAMPYSLDAQIFAKRLLEEREEKMAKERENNKRVVGENAAKIYEEVKRAQLSEYDSMISNLYSKFTAEQYYPRIRPQIWNEERMRVMKNSNINPESWQNLNQSLQSEIDNVVDKTFQQPWHRDYRKQRGDYEFWNRNPDAYWRGGKPMRPQEAEERAEQIAKAATDTYQWQNKRKIAQAQAEAAARAKAEDYRRNIIENRIRAQKSSEAEKTLRDLSQERDEVDGQNRIFGKVPGQYDSVQNVQPANPDQYESTSAALQPVESIPAKPTESQYDSVSKALNPG